MLELPPELTCSPKPFIVLTGLNVTHNAIHRSIWDAFSNNRRSDRIPLTLACLPGDHPYPKCKNKRVSYDWYIPKGLLKSGWMHKHLSQVPAVVVIFFELDWDDAAWKERHLTCASRVQVVRTSLQGRSTKVAVVLIQNNMPLPPGENLVAAERAATLCSACELSAKSLFVLPHTDHLIGYVVRLENAFLELAQSYYHTECRQIKAHKEFLNKTTHQLLFPRHQFKVAFLNELMQEPRTALKHYMQCYMLIQELRSYETNNLEIKLVSGYVNYKICHLSFLQLNAPLDAINQFRRHIDHFKGLHGSNDLVFEHSAWLCHQFTVFGELFKQAAIEGLAAIQTQHPGFYFYQAASYARGRKLLAHKLCSALSEEYPTDDPLYTDFLEFYGQRPWRQGQQRIDPPDMNREREGILALQLKEASFDHSSQIINLLIEAVTHVKKFNSQRLKLYLTVQMGEEYYHAAEYEKSTTLLKRAMIDYACSQWWLLLSRIQKLVLVSSYLVCDVTTFLTACVCCISSLSCLEAAEKCAIQGDLMRVVAGTPPTMIPFPEDDNECLQTRRVQAITNIKDAWQTSLSPVNRDVIIEMNSLVPFVQCKVNFLHPESVASSPIVVCVHIRITSPMVIRFSKLSLHFTNPAYDSLCLLEDFENADMESDEVDHDGKLLCEPWIIKQKRFEFPAETNDVLKPLRVGSVCISLGQKSSSEGHYLTFKWLNTCSDASSPLDTPMVEDCVFQQDITGITREENWERIPTRMSTHIIQRKSKLDLTIHHAAPSLVNEIYPVVLNLCSHEAMGHEANGIMISVTLISHKDDQKCTNVSVANTLDGITDENINNKCEVKFNSMQSGEECQAMIYLKTSVPGLVTFEVKLTYHVDNVQICSTLRPGTVLKSMTCCSTVTKQESLDVVLPFMLTSNVTSMSLQTLSVVKLCQPFMYMINISQATKWPIQLVSGRLRLNNSDTFTFQNKNLLKDTVLEEGECAVDCIKVTLNEIAANTDLSKIEPGSYEICWKRVDNPMPVISTVVALPPISAVNVPITVTMSTPAFGLLHSETSIKYHITNRTCDSLMVEMTLDMAEAFMFSGEKLRRTIVLPNGKCSVSYSFYPLSLGYQVLPKFRVKLNEKDPHVTAVQVDHSAMATHIYVKPSAVDCNEN